MKILRVGLSIILVVSQLVVFAPVSVYAETFAAEPEAQQIAEETVILPDEAQTTSLQSEAAREPETTETVPPQEPATQQVLGIVPALAVIEPQPLRITEVQVSGTCEPGMCTGNNAEFIEVFNPNDNEVSLKGYSLVYQNSGGTQTQLAGFADSIVLQPKQFGIVTRNMISQGTALLATTKMTLADSAGAVLLVADWKLPAESLVDQVAWGSISTGFYGDKAASAPATNKSLQRCFASGELREYDPRSTALEFIVYAAELPTPGMGLECEVPVPVQPINTCEGLKINEIGANTTEQYIELRNDNTIDMDLAGCQLQTNRSTTNTHIFAQEIVPAGGVKLVLIKDTPLTLTKTTSGVVYVLSSDGLSEADAQAYNGLASDTSWAFFADGWLQTYAPTPGTTNVALKYLPCDDGYQRNTETGRCNKIVATAALVDCGEGKYRSEETGRCRAIPAASVLAACKLGQYRSEETNRCRNIVAASTQKPCKDNQYRSEETNRCRNLTATSVPEAAFAVQPVKDSPMAFMGWWALGGVVLLAIGYAGWEWRREVQTGFARVVSTLSGKR